MELKNYHDAFIKRIIGLPGEKVEIKNGQVYINDSSIKEKYIENNPNYKWGPMTVPADSYLVLGDNRDESFDSRYWGFVPSNKIIGRAIFRFYPFDRIEVFNTPVYVSSLDN